MDFGEILLWVLHLDLWYKFNVYAYGQLNSLLYMAAKFNFVKFS